jgi:hypothetical protein
LQGEEDEAFEFLHCQDTIDSIETISLTDFLKEEEGFDLDFLKEQYQMAFSWKYQQNAHPSYWGPVTAQAK